MKRVIETPSEMALSGVKRFERGEYLSAEKRISRAISSGAPGLDWALLPRAAARISLGRFLPALADLARFINSYPDSPALKSAQELNNRALKSFLLERRMIRREEELRFGFIWKSREYQNSWMPRIIRAATFYSEMEYETVRLGIRRIMFRNLGKRPSAIELRAKGDGLVCQTLFYIKGYKSFAHHHTLSSPDAPDSLRHVVIARNAQDADEVRRIFGDGSRIDEKGHQRLGQLLGYPSCCVNFFKKEWVRDKRWDPMFEQAANTADHTIEPSTTRNPVTTIAVDGHPWCNILLRYEGIRAVSWLPCSFRCSASVSKAQEWVSAAIWSGDVHRIQMVEDLERILSIPLTWRCIGGMAFIESKYFLLIGNSFASPYLTQIQWRSFNRVNPSSMTQRS